MECGKSDLAGDHGCRLPDEVCHNEHKARGWRRVGRQCAIGGDSFQVRADVRSESAANERYDLLLRDRPERWTLRRRNETIWHRCQGHRQETEAHCQECDFAERLHGSVIWMLRETQLP